MTLTANGIVAATAAAILVMLAVRTPREEARLVERFGDDHRRYRATTGRFFPRIPA